jgi:hypothetical protein
MRIPDSSWKSRDVRKVPTGDIAPLVSILAIDVFFCSRAATGACRNPWELQQAALVLSAGVAALFFTVERTQLRGHA